jgi:hypothetical protein
MGHWESQVRNAGFEVVHEALHASFLLTAIVGYDAGSKLAGNGAALARPGQAAASSRSSRSGLRLVH